MSGLKGFQRTPRAPVRERRNSSSLSSFTQFIGASEVIQLSDLGELTLVLASDGGLEKNASNELAVKLNATNPGLQLAPAGISALVQGVVAVDASGIKINLGTGVQNDGGSLATNDSQIVHDDLAGFVANEHVDHSGVSINPSAPLTGGGDLTANRAIGISLGDGVTNTGGDLTAETRLLSASTADSTAIANTTTETDFDVDYTIPAGLLDTVGNALRITFSGKLSDTASPDLTLRLKIAGTTIKTFGPITLTGGTDDHYELSFLAVVAATGASGSLRVIDLRSVVAGQSVDQSLATASLDTTTTNDIDLSAEWSAADPGNTITLELLAVQLLGV
jgi:hypothetical protein